MGVALKWVIEVGVAINKGMGVSFIGGSGFLRDRVRSKIITS